MAEENRFFVLVDSITARVQLIQQYFQNFTDIPICFSTSLPTKKFDSQVKILDYTTSQSHVANFYIFPEGLLKESHIRLNIPKLNQIKEFWYFFPTQSSIAEIPFDLFSFIFYYLSRYEEYQNAQRDTFGRWLYEYSMESVHKMPVIPIVDHWTTEFLKIIFPNYKSKKTAIQLTFDIDQVYAFKGKSFWYQLGGGMKDFFLLRFSSLRARIQTFFTQKDPFDLFSHVQLKDIPNQTCFFFLLSNRRHPQDLNLKPESPNYQYFIKKIQQHFLTGIHPSIASKDKQELVSEIEHYKEITKGNPAISRQHFICISLPETYRNLLSLGIREDYSMGYPDKNAFRLGTAHSVPWFDLMQNELTELILHPFCMMDVTFRHYEKRTPLEAQDDFWAMCKTVERYGGTLRIIWHNSSFAAFSGWQPWRKVFDAVLGKISKDAQS